jgi:hypothetical protein
LYNKQCYEITFDLNPLTSWDHSHDVSLHHSREHRKMKNHIMQYRIYDAVLYKPNKTSPTRPDQIIIIIIMSSGSTSASFLIWINFIAFIIIFSTINSINAVRDRRKKKTSLRIQSLAEIFENKKKNCVHDRNQKIQYTFH